MENKTGKYLKYAIGEILLVMIGILLALQINTWNDLRIKKKLEVLYYENIKEQISIDRDQIERQIHYNDRHRAQFEYANEIIDINDRSKIDTLGKIVRRLTNYSDYDRQGNVYETIVNSGQIRLLSNHQIIEYLQELEHQFLYINRMENIHYDVAITFVAPSIMTSLKFSTSEILEPNEVYHFEFQNLILSLIQVMHEKDEVYHSTLNHIDRITSLIDEELNMK